MLNPLLNVNKRKLSSTYLILKTHDESSRKNKIDSIFKDAKREISGLKAIAVVETETGLAHGFYKVESDFDIESACAYNTEVLKSNIRTMKALNVKNESIGELCMDLTSQTHFIKPMLNNEFFICVAINKASLNLGITRKIINNVSEEIKKVLNV